ncbi:MAG: hypothetical protein RBS72_06670 [Sedimentisphaerales bacterium]|jgi:hypothetical protein|nr:hypothetical protein [Sedimentisphaerales bacterium]HNY77969.1 hypothetical protein [Sedimentisphaerales bacterium]HOC63365.1 hypothetical protein [Sedimentisphaerales bacterium]HOH64105.1 hypothetical protein [Sedimentisphaerales bacterium]HPY48808.1 hypothetical protein [Sedimentisphaerales bacterium]
MKNHNEFEDHLRDFCRTRHAATRTTPQFDSQVRDDASAAWQQTQPKRSRPAGSGARRIMMHSKLTGLTAAAVVTVAAIVGVIVFHDGATPAYAVEQTVRAIRKIETVYMKGEFYLQGQFECWMRFAGNPDRPTHVWLGREGYPMAKICSPDGVFGLNNRTNRVHFATRDERGMSWIPKFGSLFKDSLRQAGAGDAIRVSDGNDVITIRIATPQREQEFLVDAQTKLPIRFTTVRDDNPTQMMRQTLAVKNLVEIRYNEEPPAGIFAKPTDAIVVEQEVDCWVDPDSGLDVGEMSHEEACRELARQACQAMIDLDEARLESLALFFRLWPPQIWEQVRQMKEAGQWVQSYEITGEPYPEGDVWFLPTELKMANGKTETQTIMIKFYDFEGAKRCFSIGSKEKGVVD